MIGKDEKFEIEDSKFEIPDLKLRLPTGDFTFSTPAKISNLKF